MAELPDILALVTPRHRPGHKLLESILNGTAPGFLKMTAEQRDVVERTVARVLSDLPEGDRRAMEHSVWHRTIGASDDPRYGVIREMGPGRMGIKALTICVMMLVEQAVREGHKDAANEARMRQEERERLEKDATLRALRDIGGMLRGVK